jgi:hypothetical protein
VLTVNSREIFSLLGPTVIGVLDFRVSWRKMCSAAKVHLLHDFRRSAVRNMTRAGVPRDVAKKIKRSRYGFDFLSV